MKSFDALKQSGVIRNLKQALDREKNSSIKQLKSESGDDFSFSPEKAKAIPGGLAEILCKTAGNFKSKPEKSKSKSPIPSYLAEKSQRRRETSGEVSDFKPKINPKSLILVKNAEKEGRDLKRPEKSCPQPTPDELKPKKRTISIKEFLDRNYTQQLSKVESKKDTMPASPLDKLDSACTFRPFVSEKSREMANTHRMDFYEFEIKHAEIKRNEAQEALKKKQIEELKLCTFTPAINKCIVLSKGVSKTPEKKCSYSKLKRNLTPFEVVLGDI